MAVTCNQQPATYTPGYSPQIFTAESTQSAQPNFSYTILCTDLLSGDTQYYDVPARPDGDMVFDAKPFAESLLTHYIPLNTYGWQEADGVRKIRVNIGETYGTTPAYASGSDIDYIVWNGIVDWKEYPNYDQNVYVYDSDIDNNVYLNTNTEEDTYSGRSNYLYALTSKINDIYSIQIKTYSQAGVLLGTSTIANPNVGSSAYNVKYLCIDIGHKGLSEMASGLVGGDYPIITDNVAYYTIDDIYDDGSGFVITPLKTITIKCEPKYDVYTVQYLKKNGAFQTLNFAKLSENVLSTSRVNYSKLPFTYTAQQYAYLSSARVQFTLNTDTKQTIKLNTDWLTEDEVDYHKDLIDSPVIYFDFGTTDGYLQVMLNTNSVKLNKRYNDKLFNFTMDFEYAHSNTRQSS